MLNTPNSADYPLVLEQAWLQRAMQATGAAKPRVAVERLEGSAGTLSDAFTTGRDPSFSGYRSSPRALTAYGLFFFPRAYMRTIRVLRECRPDLPGAGAGPFRILDLGAGTGAAGLAALQVLSEKLPETPLHLDMVDNAPEGLELARSMFSSGGSLWPHASAREIIADARTFQPGKPVDVILCSFAVNEWMEQNPDFSLVDWVTQLLAQLKPGGVLILLEPALRTAVERMERLRDGIADKQMARILAPCPHHAPCPMLARRRGWCHEVRAWNVPESLRWINRRLRRDVHLLKYSFLVLQRREVSADPARWMRLVSPVKKEKGKFVFYGCGGDGRLHTCEWLTRNISPGDKIHSERLERGDKVLIDVEKRLGDGVTERLMNPPKHFNDP